MKGAAAALSRGKGAILQEKRAARASPVKTRVSAGLRSRAKKEEEEQRQPRLSVYKAGAAEGEGSTGAIGPSSRAREAG